MSRFVVLVLAVYAIFWLLKRALSGRKRGDRSADRAADRAADRTADRTADRADDPAQTGAEAVPDLVACARCGVLVPKNLAIGEEGAAPLNAPRLYCCEEHRRLGPG